MSEDRHLCYCLQVSKAIFQGLVAANPQLGFDEICAQTGVGSQCTACLLNAEEAYVVVANAGAAAAGSAQTATGPAKPLRRRIYDVIDGFSPHVSGVYSDRIPVLGGGGLQTRIAISNAVPEGDDLAPAPYGVKISRFDADGRFIDLEEIELPAGAWLDREVSAGLLSTEAGLPAVGTCLVEAKPLRRGFRGAARPHFSISTPRCSAALHAQGTKGVLSASVGTAAVNPDECQYLFLANYAAENNTISANITPLGNRDAAKRSELTLAPYAARLLPLEFPAHEDGVQLVSVEARAAVKVHLIITDATFSRISIDHV